MKHKTRLEIMLPEKLDPFTAINKLIDKGNVTKASMINFERIVIFYDNRKVTEGEIRTTLGLPHKPLQVGTLKNNP